MKIILCPEEIVKRWPVAEGKSYKTLTIAGFSAGGRAVQRYLDRAYRSDTRMPDAVLIADGLHTSYIGDPKKKQVDANALRSVVDYATDAAFGKGICVLWHSAIVPPGYASTTECCETVYREVLRRLAEGHEGRDNPHVAVAPTLKLDGRDYKIRQIGNFTVIGHKGNDAKEHVAQAHLIDEVMQQTIPWFSDENHVVEKMLEEPGAEKPEVSPSLVFDEPQPLAYLDSPANREAGAVDVHGLSFG
jgi:hypothetical protein